ncbi:hypothetical protein P3387_25285, partial [Vibrio parahaemolyticus]|nr:hypothetical protein [Vibrio parahaemolyticus]
WVSLIIGKLSGENLVLLGEMAFIPLWMELLSFIGTWQTLLVIQIPDNPGLRPGQRVAVLNASLSF